MHMLDERMQILVSPEQRRRLEVEARRRGTSVASLVREAIDARFGSTSPEERVQAVAEIAAMNGTFLEPAELNRLIDDGRLAAALPSAP
jgi:hypothetical protein